MTNRDALSVLLDECETCRGEGIGGCGHPKREHDNCGPCPDCVDGLVVPEAVVEATATAVYALDWGNHPPEMNGPVLNKSREQARAALEAAVGVLMEEEL